VTTLGISIASTRLLNSEPYEASRSRNGNRGAVSAENPSVAWCDNQPAVVRQNDHHVEQPKREEANMYIAAMSSA
jgi:hypothetical protein